MHLKREKHEMILPGPEENAVDDLSAMEVKVRVIEEETETLRYKKVLVLEFEQNGRCMLRATYGYLGSHGKSVDGNLYHIDDLVREADLILVYYTEGRSKLRLVDVVTWKELRTYIQGAKGNDPGDVRKITEEESQMPQDF